MPLVTLLPFVAVPYLWAKYENSRAINKLNALAIEEFKRAHPLPVVVDYIRAQESAIDAILAKGLDITKQDSEGKTLWSSLCSDKRFHWNKPKFSTELSIFKKLADHLFKENLSVEKKHAYFLDAINSKHFEYVQYLLETGKVRIEEFNEAQQFECLISQRDLFSNTGYKEIVNLLKKSGINLNARNNKGFTPLLHILSTPVFHRYERLRDLLEAAPM